MLIIGTKTNAQTMDEYRLFSGDCFKGNYEKVKEYVESGKSVNPPEGAPFSALYLSIMKNQLEITSFLLTNGANPNYTNNNKTTPLMGVFLYKKAIVSPLGYVKLLLKYNADVNALDEENVSVLDYAATSKNPEIISEILKKGAKANNIITISMDNKTYKYSSLTWLIANFSSLEMVKLYVAKGADVNSTCVVDGVTLSALDISTQSALENTNYTPIVNYLKQMGAKPLYKEASGTKWFSINDIIKSIGLSSSPASSSATCYTFKENVSTSICGVKVKAYKINCSKGDNDYFIAYYPGGGTGCWFSKEKGWYSHGCGVTDTQWFLITYKNVLYEEASKKACDCY